ncbi:LPXTG cell wall anchor domain-containing protein [Streptomyces sp. NPDC012746]|uniref:LPXTG cell wall anchor domain-containing protein n=1 Tax=Streptomyces sp. NPDC012746 TaxID=3364845 RepID=UPI0036C7D16F
MSARISAAVTTRRSLRTAAATAVVAAVAGTALTPLSAYAAPAEGGKPALRIELGAPVPSGPLTRGGATESFDLTVTNPSDKAAPFHPWLLGNLGSPIALKKNDVVFKVDEVNAPDTASFIGDQDGGWQGLFYPAGKDASAGFEVPAGGKLKWKVTVGLGKSFPINSNMFELRAKTLAKELAPGGDAAIGFKATPAKGPAATLSTHFENNGSCDGTNDETRCKQLMLWYRHEGIAFTSDLVTRLTVKFPGDVKHPDTQVRVMVDGNWTDVAADSNGTFLLPRMEKDFQGIPAESFALQVKLGPKTQVTQPTLVTLQADVALAENRSKTFSTTATDFKLAPAKQAATKPEQSKPAKPAGSNTQTSQTSSQTGSGSSAASSSPAAAPAGGTTQASGSLAHTGSDSNSGLYAGLAAVLVALGGAAAWLGTRRRGGVRA